MRMRRKCDQRACLGIVSKACLKSMKAVCSLEDLLGLMEQVACCRCLGINMGWASLRVLTYNHLGYDY